ncbi:MAG: ABC transporter ATP-binding protein [Planctomycetota bacterium]
MSEPPTQPVISVRNARYRFPGAERLTLCVPTLAITPGEHTAIIGPSGCGKTTLLRLIVGLLAPSEGEVRTLGTDPASLRPSERGRARLRSIGMVFQEFALLGYLSALDNITLTARLGGLDLREAKDRARRLAEGAGVAHTLARKPHRLSQGERQRIAVCRALVTHPRLIVCDEPTGNLDPARSDEITRLVLDASNDLNATVVAVTHDRSVLEHFARTIDLAEIASLERASP